MTELMAEFRRREIWLVNFDPALGGEITKTRPAIIVSNDYANKYSNRVQVVPLTSNLDKCYPPEIIFEFDGKKSKACADQIKTASKERLVKKLGEISEAGMNDLNRAIKIQLGLN
jgi:mRNA interferase MazF